MLKEKEFEKWCLDNNIPHDTKELIDEIRNSQPSRKVQSGRGNVSGFYPSRKMGVTIQFESHNVELPAVYMMEHDPSILEYYDQPKPVHMIYLSKRGRRVSVTSTPDFFVIKENEALWEEWKTEEELESLSKNSPNRYIKDNDGNWRCPPGEEYAKKFGLGYRLRSSKEINKTFYRNVKFLEDYMKNLNELEISEEKIEIAKDIVSSNFGITIDKLLENYSTFTADDINILISQNHLYFDLYNCLLAEHKSAYLFLNKELSDIYLNMINMGKSKDKPNVKNKVSIKPGSRFLWDGQNYAVLNMGLNTITAVDENDRIVTITNQNIRILIENKLIKIISCLDDEVEQNNEIEQSLLKEASPKDIEEANKRYQILKAFESGIRDIEYSQKTIQRWQKAFDQAKKLYGNGFLGLIPQKKKRGNRTTKIDTRVATLIKDVISNHYMTIKQLNMKAAYNILEDKCKQEELSPPSYVTFTKYVNNKSKFEITISRKGKRAAYQFEQWYLESSTPRHGDRPFEITHIDHTELDIELTFSHNNQKFTHRPYLTMLVDAYSRVILAHYVTFDPPSFRSNMMVLRECVRKHNRLPQTIVVDGGKEFHSIYFDSLCAQFEIVKKVRPPAKAKFGSVIERLFGTTNTKFIHNLQGNTQLTKEVRVVTKSINPKNNALWNLSQLDDMFQKWIEYYGMQPHSALGTTPKNQFEYGMSLGGERAINFIAYDDNFIIATLPATPRGTGLVQPGKGVVFNNIWYWNDEFRVCEKRKVDLKYDPFDVGVLYAYINKRWVKCLSEYYFLLRGKTHKELQLLTEEVRYKLNRKSKVSIKDIVSFMQTIEDKEKIIYQALKDKENQRTTIEPDQIVENPSQTLIKKKIDLSNIPTFEIYEN